MYYIHKYEVSQEYGGPEEGGWWYDAGSPVAWWYPVCCEDEDTAYLVCRILNSAEGTRADQDEKYGYTSVLSHQSNHYAYSVDEDYKAYPYPRNRPHYE